MFYTSIRFKPTIYRTFDNLKEHHNVAESLIEFRLMLTKMWGITLGYLIYDFIRNFRFHESYLKIEEYFIFD